MTNETKSDVQREVLPKHTPGPWATNGFNVFGPLDPSSTHENGRTLVGGVVDDANDWRSRPIGDPIERAQFREERIANANLIAAAPDLLAALKTAQLVIHAAHPVVWRGCPDAVCVEIRAAIAKAEGRE